MDSNNTAGMASPVLDQKTLSYSNTSPSSPYMVNSKILIVAIIILFIVIVFIVALHVYAKWRLRNSYVLSGLRQGSWRRRGRLDFAAREGYQNLASAGLDKSVIDRLPTFVYKAQESEEAAECAVCLCEFRENEKGRLLPKCNHSFHVECIDMWFHSHSSCPICRTSAKLDAIPVASARHEARTVLMDDNPSLLQLQNSEISQPSEVLGSSAIPLEVAASDLTRESSESLQGSRYPTNVLFWGNQSHVSSRATSAPSKQVARSVPHIAVDIPKRSEGFLALQSPSSGTAPCKGHSVSSPQCSFVEEQSSSSDGRVVKSPTARLKTLKRLLSRDRKAFPTELHGDCEAGDTVSNA